MRFALAVSMVVSIGIFLSSAGGCGHGIFPEVSSSSSTTSTSTPVANAYLYATNFRDGTVSAFTRNTSTGALGFIAKQTAGASNGPEGVAVTAGNDLVYVANAADGNVYQYAIATSGVLGSLTSLGKIASGTTPQMIAIDSSDNYVYVTNSGSKTVTEYVINPSGTGSPGMLTFIQSFGSFAGQPFGIVAHPTLGLVYVNDSFGLIYSFLVNSDGTLSPIGTAVPANGGTLANPGQMAIAIDSTQSYLFVDDKTLGVVSVFSIQSTGALFYSGTFASSQSTSAIGIGSVINAGGVSGANYVLTANPNVNFVQPFTRTNATLAIQSAVNDPSGPTGLVIDPQGFFAYTGNSGSGTIALLGLQNTSQCGSAPVCVIKNFASESPANNNAGTQFVATTH